MMRISKLMVIAVLTGTLGLVGCGDDNSTTDGSGGAGGGGMLEACGAGESLDESFETDTGMVTCDGLGVLEVPIEIVLAAKPMGDIAGEVDFELQAQLNLSEDTVGQIGAFAEDGTIGDASVDVDDAEGSALVSVSAATPCSVDFSDDPDNNGTPGPIIVTTPVEAGAWTDVDGSIVLEATDINFVITAPVPLSLSTAGENPPCLWNSVPTLTFPPAIQ